MLRAFALLGVVLFIPGVSFAQVSSTTAPAPPSPLVQPACANRDQQAQVVRAVSPEYPTQAIDNGLSQRIVLVLVTVNARGYVSNATVNKSSGDVFFDQSAVRAARDSIYAPAIVNCVAVTRNYIFKAVFNSRPPRFRCLQPSGPAAVLKAGIVKWPASARPTKLTTAVVKVTLDSDGYVVAATVYQSTGSPALDQSAIDAVRQSTFAPACASSLPTESTFGYEVDFDPNAPSPSPLPVPSP